MTHCHDCLKKAAKVGIGLYVAHWLLHAIVFVISPTLGAIFVALF